MTQEARARSVLAHRVAEKQLTPHEQNILRRNQMTELVDTAVKTAALKPKVTQQLGEAANIQVAALKTKAEGDKLIQEGNAKLQKEEEALQRQQAQLKRAEARAPHLETTVLLSSKESKYEDPHAMSEAEHKATEVAFQRNLKQLYNAQHLAKKFARQAKRYKQQADKPWDKKTIPMDADIVAHVKKYTDVHEAAESEYQKSKKDFEDATFNAPELADARENRGKHIMVEETKVGLSASLQKSEDIDEVFGGSVDRPAPEEASSSEESAESAPEEVSSPEAESAESAPEEASSPEEAAAPEETASPEEASVPEESAASAPAEEPKELGESKVSLLQESEDTKDGDIASEIASKAFSWEQNRQDTAAMKIITQKVIARKQANKVVKESEAKFSRTSENFEKRSAKKAQMQKVQARAQDQATWEIASKAFKQTQEESKKRMGEKAY